MLWLNGRQGRLQKNHLLLLLLMIQSHVMNASAASVFNMFMLSSITWNLLLWVVSVLPSLEWPDPQYFFSSALWFLSACLLSG